jgi:citrate lyase subunit beta/citryl-CoA lyase
MRSLLFVPADSERKLARAPQSGADGLILDLEDSVVPANRPLARRQTRDFLSATGSIEFRRYVRINPLSSGVALADLAARRSPQTPKRGRSPSTARWSTSPT